MDRRTSVAQLKALIDRFVGERDWHQFHTPKNLAMGLAVEAAELMELFQWLSGPESLAAVRRARTRRAAADELADIVIYALGFANAAGIDVAAAVRAKLRKNRRKYPVRRYRGRF